MPQGHPSQRLKFELPEEYARAIRMRAALDGVDMRDVVIAALDAYIAGEIAAAQAKLKGEESTSGARTVPNPRGRRRSTE